MAVLVVDNPKLLLVVSAYSSYKSEKSKEFKAPQQKQRKTETDTLLAAALTCKIKNL